MSNNVKKCKIRGCSNRYLAKGYCSKHYQEMARHSKLGRAKCSVHGCEREVVCKGMCKMHYTRMRSNGTLTPKINQKRIAKQHPHIKYTYRSMVQRCYDKNSTGYEHYGGRGIKVCDRWLGVYGLENFYIDMGDRPEGTSLDRIDVNGDYCPENCRWADRWTQAKNKRQKQCYSKCTGVTYNKRSRKWDAYLQINHREYRVNYLKTEKEAIEARHRLEQKYLNTYRQSSRANSGE